MAARLCINSIFQTQYERYMPQVNVWAERHVMLERESLLKAAHATQECVDYYCAKIFERSYFGDNYHNNLLACFGLCWTRDIYVALLGERDEITPANAHRLLRVLKDKEPIFEANLGTVNRVESMTRTETGGYYRDKYARLQSLLHEAIALDETIDFSR